MLCRRLALLSGRCGHDNNNHTRTLHPYRCTDRRSLHLNVMTDSKITLTESNQEIIRIDSEGFYYRGEFIADAGTAHCLLVTFLQRHTSMHPEIVVR